MDRRINPDEEIELEKIGTSNNEKRTVLCEEIEGTPFMTVMMDEENQTDYILAIGTERVSLKTFTTRQEAIDYLETKPWDILGTWMIAMTRWGIRLHEEEKLARKEEGGE